MTTCRLSSLSTLTTLLCSAAILAACDDQAIAAPAAPAPSARIPRVTSTKQITTASPAVLGITATPRSTPATQLSDYGAAFDTAAALRAKGIVQVWNWSTLEPDSAHLSGQRVIQDVKFARSRNLQVFAGIQIINTVKREFPGDIAKIAWSDPRLLARFERLLDSIAPVLGSITYLSIGNEVGTYLAKSGEWDGYLAFFRQAAAAVKRRAPAIKVGATQEYLEASRQSARAQSLISLSDIAIYTYYPFSSGLTVAAPTITRTTFDDMIRLAGGKPVVIQELGYPASTANGSSDAMQAQFFTDAIAQWKARRAQMPFVSLFQLHDFSDQQCRDFLTYYGAPNQAEYYGYLCSLGLRKSDGTARPSFGAVRTAVSWLP